MPVTVCSSLKSQVILEAVLFSLQTQREARRASAVKSLGAGCKTCTLPPASTVSFPTCTAKAASSRSPEPKLQGTVPSGALYKSPTPCREHSTARKGFFPPCTDQLEGARLCGQHSLIASLFLF